MGDLKVTHYDPKNPGSFGGVQSLSKVADQPTKEWLSGQETCTLHRPVRRNFQRPGIIVSDIDDQWQADLIDLTKLKKFNNGHKFMLIVIDVCSKFARAEPLKNKTSKSILKVFAKIVNRSGRKPLFLYTDRGLEFTNKLFQRWLKKKQIHFLTPQNQETKAAIAERMVRTLLSHVWRYFTFKDTKTYVDVLPDFLRSYNRKYHRSIKRSPDSVSPENEVSGLRCTATNQQPSSRL